MLRQAPSSFQVGSARPEASTVEPSCTDIVQTRSANRRWRPSPRSRRPAGRQSGHAVGGLRPAAGEVRMDERQRQLPAGLDVEPVHHVPGERVVTRRRAGRRRCAVGPDHRPDLAEEQLVVVDRPPCAGDRGDVGRARTSDGNVARGRPTGSPSTSRSRRRTPRRGALPQPAASTRGTSCAGASQLASTAAPGPIWSSTGRGHDSAAALTRSRVRSMSRRLRFSRRKPPRGRQILMRRLSIRRNDSVTSVPPLAPGANS